MNDLLMLIYLGDISSSLGFLLFITGVLSCIAGIICWPVYFEIDEKYKGVFKGLGIFLPIFAFSLWLAAALLPSKRFYYIAAGAKATEKVIESSIGQKTLSLIEQKLDEALGVKK